jgi:hypothetical protein
MGAIVSVIVSLLISPKFLSSVVIYPASTSSVSKALLTDMTMSPKDVMKFGEEEETEQLLQILQSDEIKARIIAKYDLVKHYKVDSGSKFYKTKLLNKYNSNISSRKTKYQAVEIRVLDTDAGYAASIANDIAALLDSVYNKIQKERALKALKLVEQVYLEKQSFVKQLEDSLSGMRKIGVYDYENQAKVLSDAYTKAIGSGNQSTASGIKKELDKLAKYSSSYQTMSRQHEDEIKNLVFLKSKLTEARVDAYHDLPYKYVVNPAQVSEKKAYPKRSLIVMFTTISSFIFAIFFLVLIQRFKQLKSELKN